MKEERRTSRSVGWAAPPRVATQFWETSRLSRSCERQYKRGRCLFHDLYLVTFLDFCVKGSLAFSFCESTLEVIAIALPLANNAKLIRLWANSGCFFEEPDHRQKNYCP